MCFNVDWAPFLAVALPPPCFPGVLHAGLVRPISESTHLAQRKKNDSVFISYWNHVNSVN